MSGEGSTCTIEPCNPVAGSPNYYTGNVEYQGYGSYRVSEASAIVFVVFFSISSIAHLVQTTISRPLRSNWYLYATIGVCGAGEILGWAGRLWSNLSFEWWPSEGGSWGGSDNSFMIQICCLIISPSFFIAANYIILGRLIRFAGARFIHLNPRTYTKLFIFGDIISIIIQAIGGGTAAPTDASDAQANAGAHIMVAGIVFQIVVMLGFISLLVEFTYRVYHQVPVKSHWHPFVVLCWSRRNRKARDEKDDNMPGVHIDEWTAQEHKNVKTVLAGVYITTLFVFVRGCYRTAELSRGWNSPLNENQITFCILDGAMIALSFLTWNIIHPGRLIPNRTYTAPVKEGSPAHTVA